MSTISRHILVFVLRISFVGLMMFVSILCAMVVANGLAYIARPVTASFGLDSASAFEWMALIFLTIAVVLPLIYAAHVCQSFAQKYDLGIDRRLLWVPVLNFVLVSLAILKNGTASPPPSLNEEDPTQ